MEGQSSLAQKSNLYLYAAQAVVLLPVFYYWLDQRSFSLSDLNILAIFPLLGLVAFVMMWFHLMIAYLKRTKSELFNYKSFYRKTSNIVLVLIILHPLLVFIKAYEFEILAVDFAGEDQRLFGVFGLVALLFFLVYEVVERLRKSSFVKNNWEFVVAMNRVGFILVYLHGLQLGQHLQAGWLKGLWLFFGLTTLVYFAWAYYQEISRRSQRL